MADSIYVRKSTVLLVVILTSIILIGTPIGFIIWFNYDVNYGFGEIVIRKDQDFKNRYDFPGSGTLNDPYIIADYNIDTSKDYAIYIEETTMHFLITNCTIKCQNQGIFVRNTAVSTARIENNDIQKTSYSSDDLIKILYSPGVYVIKNNLTHFFEDNYFEGLVLGYSENALIANNSCSNIGIYIFNSDSILLEFNFVESCIDAIVILFSHELIISYNILFNNVGYGVKLYSCYGNEVHHNNFIGNAIDAGFDSQGYDEENNSWFDTINDEGNYWSDLVWDDGATYEIEGYYDVYDLYPLEFPVVI